MSTRTVYSFPGSAPSDRSGSGSTPDGHLVLPHIDEGLAEGVVIQLWVRRRSRDGLQTIVELRTEDEASIVLESGERAEDVRLRVTTPAQSAAIVATRALPLDRFVLVRARVGRDGTGTLWMYDTALAHGPLHAPGPAKRDRCLVAKGTNDSNFHGELADLQIWRTDDAPFVDEPEAGSPGLWGFYRLAGSPDDAAGGQKAAKIKHDPEVLEVAAALGGPWPKALQIGTAVDAATRLSPLRSLSGALTVQAWIRPGALEQDQDVVQLADGPRGSCMTLTTRPGGGLALRFRADGTSVDLCQAGAVLRAGAWSHVTATLAANGTSTLHVDGRPAATGAAPARWDVADQAIGSEEAVGETTQAKTLYRFARAAIVPAVSIRAATFAELRLWGDALDDEEVAAQWRNRAVGNEPRLLACYRLDEVERRTSPDIGISRGYAQLSRASTQLVDAERLLIAPTRGAGVSKATVRGKLLRDWLSYDAIERYVDQAPESTTPGMSLRLATLPTEAEARKQARIGQFGPREGDRVHCSVYEAQVEPRTAKGEPVPSRELDVSIDGARIVVIDDGDDVRLESWAPHTTHRLATDATGILRLRIVAFDQLDCPMIRLHFDDLEPDVWVMARPADAQYDQMRDLTGAQLKTPSRGRPSPLPSDADDDDAEALASLISGLANVLPGTPRTGSGTATGPQTRGLFKKTKNFFKDVGDAIDDAIDDVGDAIDDAVDAVDKAANMVVSGEAFDALVEEASKVTATAGIRAIRNKIAQAKQLAVVLPDSDDLLHMVQIVGTYVEDGVEKAWRAVVTGIDDAISSIVAIAEKVGAFVERIVDMLAMMFDWQRFLAMSDRIYDQIAGGLADIRSTLDLASFPSRLEQLSKDAAASPLAAKPALEVFPGIIPDAEIPGFDELMWFIKQSNKMMSSVNLELDLGPEISFDGLDGFTEVVDRIQEAIPMSMLTSPASIVGSSMQPLANMLPSVWGLIEPMLQGLFDVLDEAVDGTLDAIETLLLGRIKVPYITKLIEETILDGRKLDVLRLFSMLGAIPMVIARAVRRATRSGDGSDSATVTPTTRDASATASTDTSTASTDDDNDDPNEVGVGIVVGCSVINSIVLATLSTIDLADDSKTKYKAEAYLNFIYAALSGVTMVGRMVAVSTMDRRPSYHTYNMFLDFITALDTTFQGTIAFALSEAPSDAVRERAKVAGHGLFVLELIIAGGYMGTAIAAAEADDSTDGERDLTLVYWSGGMFLRTLAMIGEATSKTLPKGRVSTGELVKVFASICVAAWEVSFAAYGTASTAAG